MSADPATLPVAASASERIRPTVRTRDGAKMPRHSGGSARWRSRLHSLASWWLAAALIGIAIPGCAKHEPPAAVGQVLRISQRNEPTDLDPGTASLPDEFFVIRALSEGLLTPNPSGGEPLPAAAERYDVSADGLTYTFYLRSAATWSNGEPVVADDFVASFRRVLTPVTAAPKAHLFHAVKNARAFATGALSDFAAVGVRARSPHTLAVTLEQPLRQFPRYVASGPWIPVNPRVIERDGRAWTEPEHYVGNGPFVLVEWRPHRRIVVRKNPRYRDAAHVRLQEIQFLRFDSQDTEERAYRAGQVDVTMAVPQTKLEVYARERPAELHRAPLAETRFIAFNTKRAPLSDVRVRRALALAIDRDRIVKHVTKGGQIAAPNFLSPALLAASGDAAGPDLRAGRVDERDVAHASVSPDAAHTPPEFQTFDPAEARRLLAQAGFPNGDGFPKVELAGWVQNPVLDAIQEMWRQELGIEARIVIQEAKVHLAAVNAGNYDIAFVTNLLDVPDPTAALHDFTTDAPNNFPHWQSTDFDRLIASSAAVADPSKARDALRAAERLLLGEAPVAPVYFNVQNWLMSPRVHGWQQDALWSRRYNDLSLDQ